MCPSSSDHDKSIQDLLATVQTAKPRPSRKGRSSPKNRFDVDREKSAARVDKLRAQQQKSRELSEYCDRAVAEIRASLERSQGGGG
jgi:hypothetical protein